ncbi:methylenetetrahydrofolate--tRNA-(uracil(54)-C(5))-methyltransferase (FADH(2)-oxidizing) TrmFO [Clostridia bacterium]|nr:methylenetetrahydrofolate--tRNA-(uracil(54)-C(5))-methyltransferase (FADH(2)-oxidizing) TrmFO [Clostridia bacterium]
MTSIKVIGGGLAGAEASYQLAQRGHKVTLYEMRPTVKTKAHQTGELAELVCSNSLRSADVSNGAGLLKEELRRVGSLIMRMADLHQVPAGGALAVDRLGFSRGVSEAISNHPNIEIVREEIESIPKDGYVVVASGPLTEGALAASIQELCSEEYFHFFDAAAPVVTLESINMDKAWWASRYDKGEADYINCALNQEEYEALVDFLIKAEKHKPEIEGEEQYFEGCMPVEEMARRGAQTLSFGPLKPVGLVNPHTGKEAHAVVQLRIDNKERTLFNLVGFQTSLTFGEQKKMMSLIPGLENAEIVRYGVMHQNSYIKSPLLLNPDGSFKKDERIYFAGQITGVEGYIESTASGFIAGLNLARKIDKKDSVYFPKTTAIGSLMGYITEAEAKNFQPMHINWGLIPKMQPKIRKKKLRNEALAKRALEELDSFLIENGIRG